jgi:hypothetical protein
MKHGQHAMSMHNPHLYNTPTLGPAALNQAGVTIDQSPVCSTCKWAENTDVNDSSNGLNPRFFQRLIIF